MAKIKLVQNDNLPWVQLTLTDQNTALPLDLSASATSVQVFFRAVGETTILATLACTKKTSGADGVVLFNFPGETLNVAEGEYEGEIEITYDTLKQSVYDTLKFTVRAEFA